MFESVVSNTQRGYDFTLEILEWFEKSKNKKEEKEKNHSLKW
jgi:hypothetical protein